MTKTQSSIQQHSIDDGVYPVQHHREAAQRDGVHDRFRHKTGRGAAGKKKEREKETRTQKPTYSKRSSKKEKRKTLKAMKNIHMKNIISVKKRQGSSESKKNKSK
jgi:hypothetical protein